MCASPGRIADKALATVDFLHAGVGSRTKPEVKTTKPVKPKHRIRRPRLTCAVIEGLYSVYADALVHLDVRVGCGEAKPNDIEYRGIDYLDALIDWYEATHPNRKVTR